MNSHYKGKDIFVSVHTKDKESVKLLTQLGFQWTEKVSFIRVLGKTKTSREKF